MESYKMFNKTQWQKNRRENRNKEQGNKNRKQIPYVYLPTEKMKDV